jgi:hypothetical protein
LIQVLDTLDGLFRLTTRTPTLEGSVPLRVARGCVPLLEGNAYGLQVTLTQRLHVRRRLGRWEGTWAPGAGDVERQHLGAWPRLVEERRLPPGSGWVRVLQAGLVRGTTSALLLVTGLLVRPASGVWLRLTAAANRRNTLIDVGEQLIPDDPAWVPLVLELKPRRGAPSSFTLEGELACIGALRPGVHFETVPIAAAPELAAAHAAFYNRAYFEEKREDVTGKYRRDLGRLSTAAPESGAARCRLALVGSSRHKVVPLERFTTAEGPRPVTRPQEPRRLESVVFGNELAFAALFDGQTVALDYDRERLAACAQPVAAAWRAVLAGSPALEHPGAGLYLTKYFTPHVAGEPNFFVKPWALTATPPGWVSLVDGFHGPGYDILRGVVATDVFHATPAVFKLHADGQRIRVAQDTPLVRVIPVPRAWLSPSFELRGLE